MPLIFILQGKESNVLTAKKGADTVFNVIFIDDDGNPVSLATGTYKDILFYTSQTRTANNLVFSKNIDVVDATTGYGTLTITKDDADQLGLATFYLYGRYSDGAGTVASLTIEDAGTNITAHPAVSITAVAGDSGSGATATVNVGAYSAAPNAGGTGYVVGDVVTHADAGSSAVTAATFQVDSVSSGAITALSVIEVGEYSAIVAGDTTGAAVTGGTGSGATVDVVWQIVSAAITAAGSGYGVEPTVTLTDGGNANITSSLTGVSRQISERSSKLTID